MKLILDYSKWRCGGEGVNKLGEGVTSLRNAQGFECCLGQFACQINKKINELLSREVEVLYSPSSTGWLIDGLTEYYLGQRIVVCDTILTQKAMVINDDVDTTPDEKIVLLKEIFEIEVINHP